VVKRFTGATGKVLIKHASWVATFVGKKYVLNLTGGMAPVTIPCDTYTVTAFAESVKSKNGESVLQCNFPSFNPGKVYEVHGPAVAISANKTVALAIGSPVIAKLEIEYLERRQVCFAYSATSAAGGPVNVQLASGQLPNPPKVTIVTADGRKVTSFTMEYG
jgi:hypothetical protein